ncbi:cytochrome P450 6B1-like [Microplitis mediator]|uniref:cytochrome P450 6B1-like n=1 Tax=Microplitis mediator TaxID=375433 RepID=UPI002553DD17|nr:cytochrome P450 6B1-like [Microplitis mediator]
MGILILIITLHFYFTRNYNFWKSRGVIGPKPLPIFGTIHDIIIGKRSIGTYAKEIYDNYPAEKFVGVYGGSKPILVLRDTELIKDVLIKHFNVFMDRGLGYNEKQEPLSAHLVSLDAKRWRLLRQNLSPMFTSCKLKNMFYLIAHESDRMVEQLSLFDGKDIDIREITNKYTINVIGTCIFGLQIDNASNIFYEMGQRFFRKNLKNKMRFRLRTFAPFLFNLIGSWLTDWELQNFYINLTRENISYRKEKSINRHDFIDLMAKLKDESDKVDNMDITYPLIAAQLFAFMVGGYESSSITISNCIYELALNNDVQNKLREEINESFINTRGVITYDLLKEMNYLDKVFNETLRKYPPINFTMRVSSEKYTFSGTNLTIPKGVIIWIPIMGIQKDPKYYPNPELFDPERFENGKSKRPPMSYLPFGDGPRNCIGWRFGEIQVKIGLINFLKNFKVHVCEKTDKNYTFDHTAFFSTPLNGIHLNITGTVAILGVHIGALFVKPSPLAGGCGQTEGVERVRE